MAKKVSRAGTVVCARSPLGAEATYLPALLRGLGVTMRHFFRNIFGRRDTVTVEYPETKTPYPPRFRGLHRLMLREDGTERCVACMMCPTVCPAHCITIVPGEREACPCDAIRMDTGIHMPPQAFRIDGILGKEELMSRGALSTATQGGRGAGWDEQEPAGERGPESKAPAAPR